MRRFLCLLMFCGLFSFMAQSQETGIIPTPQKVEVREGFCSFYIHQLPNVETQIIASFPVDTNADQGYILDVLPDKILIQATTETGLFYGRQSVNQLLRFYSSFCVDKSQPIHLPCYHIVDYPKLKYRGWMDDISRGPIPNINFLKRVIMTLAEYKMNFFNLYAEHVFKLDKYPDVAPTDGLTASEIKELEEFAAQYHIELFGNQQCLAHAEKTLRIPFYQDMADTKANWNPGKEETYDFLKYELETVARAYQSPFFNIDCDETEALGYGKAKTYLQQSGLTAGQVYAQHVNRMYNILKPLGKRVMMWGDIAAKDPEITARLPKDMLMVVWSYAAADSYVDMIKPFTDQHLDFMVAPGMSMWSTVYPSYETYTKNIANLVRDGYQNGALGMMNTAWDDSGESLFNSTWHGMAWAAEMSWKPISNTEPAQADVERKDRLDVFNNAFYSTFVYPTDEFKLISALEHTDIQNFFQNSSLYESIWDMYPSKITDEAYQKNKDVFHLIQSKIKNYEVPLAHSNKQYDASVRIAHYTCLRQQAVAYKNMLRYKISRYLNNDKSFSKEEIEYDIRETLRILHQAKMEYVKLWDEESRSYSRDIVEKRFDAVAQELLNIPYQVLFHSDLNDQGQAVVTLRTVFNDQDIYYTVDGRKPLIGENHYTSSFTLEQATMVRAATKNAMEEEVISEQYVLIHKGMRKISKLNTEYATYRPQYAAAGRMALADGIMGSESYLDGRWQGYWGQDIDVEFDFGKVTSLSHFKTHFFQDVYDWIMSPQTVEIYTSKDGKNYQLHRKLTVPNVDYNSSSKGIYTLQDDDLKIKSRYVRVVIKNGGVLPSWHQAAGQASYIFCDEIILD